MSTKTLDQKGAIVITARHNLTVNRWYRSGRYKEWSLDIEICGPTGKSLDAITVSKGIG